jgi:hypothetical protein
LFNGLQISENALLYASAQVQNLVTNGNTDAGLSITHRKDSEGQILNRKIGDSVISGCNPAILHD